MSRAPAGCPVAHGALPHPRRSRGAEPDGVPVYRPDLYSRAAIADPYPHYAAMRALGPVVWLARQRLYALPRYETVRQVLSQDLTYRSGGGVALNPVSRLLGRTSTLLSDGEVHQTRRRLVAHRLTPRALRPLQAQIDERAVQAVEAALARGTVDGVRDLALALPLTIVPDLVGWPERGRDRLVEWAGAIFDSLGPANPVMARTLPASMQVLAFVVGLARRRDVLPGSLADEILAAVDDGRVPAAQCPGLLIDYLAPSIDTTAGAIAAALHLFATHDGQWQLLRRDPGLVPAAVQEVVRLASPLRAFGRRAHVDTVLAGTPVPAGARLLVMYASANRDERAFPEPDRFDITRDASAHVGFGYGTHGCAGQGLARMETQAVLRALLPRVRRLELAGEPELAVNNVIHRFESLPVRLVPEESR